MKTRDLYDCGKKIVALSDRMRRRQNGKAPTERKLLGPVYGLLLGHFGKIDKEVHVSSAAWKKVKRIDFQRFGPNAVDIEFAVRTNAKLGAKPFANANRAELLKLTRRKSSQRYLLLVDISDGGALTKSDLQKRFHAIHSGKGKFRRRNVRVVYIHRNDQFAFTWNPKKT